MAYAGEFIALITFPGVIILEISHRFMCDVFKVPVYKIDYFNLFSEKSGPVQHEQIHKLRHNLIIALEPLLFNSILCMLFTLPFISLITIQVHPDTYFMPLYLLLAWIGKSMHANAFPAIKILIA